MKKTIFNSITILLAVFLMSTNIFSQSNDALRKKIESMNKETAKAMIEGKYEESLKYYTSDAISMPNNSEMVKGLDAIKKSNEMMMQSGIKFNTFDTQIQQIMSCENQVIEIGKYKMSMTIPGMTSDYEDHGKYLTIWEKQSDGSLKIKLEMWNTDVNPMSGGTTAGVTEM